MTIVHRGKRPLKTKRRKEIKKNTIDLAALTRGPKNKGVKKRRPLYPKDEEKGKNVLASGQKPESYFFTNKRETPFK